MDGALQTHYGRRAEVDSSASWLRMLAGLALSTIGSFGIWAVVVILPAVQAEFGVARGQASFPYTATMLGFAFGAVLHGRLADRFGIVVPAVIGSLAMGLGCVLASFSGSLLQFALAQGVLVGMLGSAAMFGPLVADVSQWFERRRGLAVSVVASGNYLAGTIWPPLLQAAVAAVGWREAYLWSGLIAIVLMLPITLALRRPPPPPSGTATRDAAAAAQGIGVPPGVLQALLVLAGLSCCVAMSMPQVHIVAYCGDLGFGPARGAEMLALMLGFGVVSRIASGWIADRIGGVKTLIAGSTLQCIALIFYLPADGLASLYVVSILFGLAQGGIVPSYAIIVREVFPAGDAGARVGLVLMSTIVGMAAGGWLSGWIFDLTGSYQAAFLHGIAWNLVNMAVALWLLLRMRATPRVALA